MSLKFKMASLLLVSMLLTSCMTSSKGEVVLSESQEYYAGRAAAAKSLTALKVYNEKDPQLLDYITRIGYAIVLNSDRAEMYEGYNFAIIEDDQINGFTFPSGFVFISTGAIKHAKNEDELAAILAHEIAHVNLRHPEVATINELKKGETAKMLAEGAKIGMTIFNILQASKNKEPKFSEKDIEKLSGALGGVADQLGTVVVKGYERDQELEADDLGLELLARTGYNPVALRNYIERLGKQSSSAKGWLNNGHPDPKDRIVRINELIKKNNYQEKDVSPRINRFNTYTAKVRSNQ
ncbi:MAG: M48 family metalloprotease [Planctomycetes bacterium]|nr:M48 family metalloprotease [Planctomycetota bacterium]